MEKSSNHLKNSNNGMLYVGIIFIILFAAIFPTTLIFSPNKIPTTGGGHYDLNPGASYNSTILGDNEHHVRFEVFEAEPSDSPNVSYVIYSDNNIVFEGNITIYYESESYTLTSDSEYTIIFKNEGNEKVVLCYHNDGFRITGSERLAGIIALLSYIFLAIGIILFVIYFKRKIDLD